MHAPEFVIVADCAWLALGCVCAATAADCTQDGRTCLHLAAEAGSDAVVAYCVEARGRDVDARNDDVSHVMCGGVRRGGVIHLMHVEV